MNTITVRKSSGVLCLKLPAPLPRSCEGWESVVSGVHHACLGRSAHDGLLIDLQGIQRLSSADIGGIARCLATVLKAGDIPCRIRVVANSPHVRRVFEVCSTVELAACATREDALASLSAVH